MDVKRAEFVCWVEPGAETVDLVNDAKAATWQHEAEHGLLRLATGELVFVRGGRKGFELDVRGEGGERTLHMDIEGREVRVTSLVWHTHPMVTGPSDDDLKVLEILGQAESVIYELGGSPDGTRISPKPEHPSG